MMSYSVSTFELVQAAAKIFFARSLPSFCGGSFFFKRRLPKIGKDQFYIDKRYVEGYNIVN